jgi:hypothetical protein
MAAANAGSVGGKQEGDRHEEQVPLREHFVGPETQEDAYRHEAECRSLPTELCSLLV